MKFYNPFKPHVCQFTNGKFAIRKLDFTFAWLYLDQEYYSDYWWSAPHFVQQYCTVDDISKLKHPSDVHTFKIRKQTEKRKL